jgi:hypothetical protein
MYINDSQRMPQGQEGIPTQEHLGQAVMYFFGPQLPVAQAGKGPGAPRRISQTHLWMSLLLCVLQGMSNFQQWRRLVCTQVVGGWQPIHLTDDALIKRLEQAGVQEIQQLFEQVSGWIEERFGHVWSMLLAPFASEILAIDECTLDRIYRHLRPLRALANGDEGLLAGKVVGLFDVRRQQWKALRFLDSVRAQGPVHAIPLLQSIQTGALLLFDLGYFSFPWLDYLTERGYFYVCRLREQTHYQIAHIYYQHDQVLDAWVWLGCDRRNRTGALVRLVCFSDGEKVRSYLSNVYDPRQLHVRQIAQLYARRWEIELAFLTLKEYLGLHHWWSGKRVHIEQQLWLILTVAQLYQALRMVLAAELHLDPFDVSLPLLMEQIPYLLRERQAPVAWLREHGWQLGLLRPNPRVQTQAPEIPDDSLCFPSEPVPLMRPARYRTPRRCTKQSSGASKRKRKREQLAMQQQASGVT